MEEKNYSFDYGKLRGRIVEKYKTQDNFSREMDIDRSSLSLKLNGKRQFSQSEIIQLCDALSIPYDEIPAYFFRAEVSKTKPEEDYDTE